MKIPTDKEILEKIHFQRSESGRLEIVVLKDIYIEIWGQWYVIPMGLHSDGASIPRIFF
jgi:hypothetical protein